MVSIDAQSEADDLFSALRGTPTRTGYRLHCPAHDDRHPSLDVTVRDNTLLLICRAGCSQEAVIGALREKGLWPPTHGVGAGSAAPSLATSLGTSREGSAGAGPYDPQEGNSTPFSEPTHFAPIELPMKAGRHLRQLPPDGIEYIYRDEHGRPRHRVVRLPGKRFVQERWEDGRWVKGLAGMEPLLYRLPEIAKADRETPIFLVEGEKDADRLAELGLVATTCAMGAQGWRVSYSVRLAGRRIVVIPDNDEVGKDAARQRCKALTHAKCEVKLLRLPDLPEHGDVSDWLDAGNTKEELLRLVRQTSRWEDLPPVRLATVPLEQIEVQPVHWLWHPYLPSGKLTLMDGDPGVGKSFLSLAIATAVTRGFPLPGADPSSPGTVLLLCGEDALEDTVKPRLLSLGVEQSRVTVVTGILREEEETPMLLSEDGLALLDAEIARLKPALVIIDPLVAYLHGSVDMHRANEVRSILRPLSATAQRHGTAILALRHLTKAPGGQALYRGQGSIDFAAAARSILLVAKDPDDPTRRIVAPTKSSLSEPGSPLAFRIHTDPESPFLWEGTVTTDAQQLLGGWSDPEETSQLGEAKSFLKELLATGPMSAKEIYKEAKSAGIAEKTLERAKLQLGIASRRLRTGEKASPWCWHLPQGRHDGDVDDLVISGSSTGLPSTSSRSSTDDVPPVTEYI